MCRYSPRFNGCGVLVQSKRVSGQALRSPRIRCTSTIFCRGCRLNIVAALLPFELCPILVSSKPWDPIHINIPLGVVLESLFRDRRSHRLATVLKGERRPAL